jgi:uncharacterized protein
MESQPVKHVAVRLLPGTDLRVEIERLVTQYHIKAGWIITCVGSLSKYSLRFANQNTASEGAGHFEIVSLVGTLSTAGCHLHICLSDNTGATIGGHLLEGCVIYTTAELVIANDQEFIFEREIDNETGWKELRIKSSDKL